MSRERMRRIEELFGAALDRPVDERDAFLDEACGDDADLRAELEDLLRRDEREDTELPLPQIVVQESESVPERIGAYRIVRPIGEGGFAVVYLAEQTEPLRREVALKVLKAGLDTKATLARFAAERQALAVMNHDGIARIYDAGETERGRPYFAMEYVEGRPITSYCDQHALATDERLELFAAVCDAVHHAHQKGVIHRDLKPSNILVTEAEGSPRVKVIDFGIAKAMATDLAGNVVDTQFGQILGTPEYMSPEQAGSGPGDLDTRTDIYSLGVVLYELLAGVPPFSRDTLARAGFAEIQRIIREEDPPRPSTRLSTLGADGDDVARRHRSTPRELIRQLRGELDWVVLKSMEKDRERRYGAPAELAADLRRFLRHEPLVARPPSVGYRLRKFSRRNKIALTVAAGLAVGLIGLTAGVTFALIESNRQRALTEQALEETALARDEAEAVTEFLSTMLGAVSPYQGGRDVTVVEVLESTAAGLDEEIGDRPLVATRVRRAIGVAYNDLGYPDRAEPLVRRAFADHESLLGPEHPQTLTSLDEIGDNLMLQDRVAEAESLYAELYAQQVRVYGIDDRRPLMSMHQRGCALAEMSRYAEAESLLVESWERAQRVIEPDDQVYLSFASNLANVYADMGRVDDAAPLLELVREERTRLHGEKHPAVLETWNNLAMLYADQGRFRESLPLLARASSLQNELIGPTHHEALITRNNLAAIHGMVFEWDEARRVYEEGLELALEQRGTDERVVQHMINNLGYLHLRRGDLDRAEELLRQAYELRLEHYGREHRDTSVSINNLGELALLRGNVARADSLHALNLEIRSELLGKEHPHTLATLVNLGQVRLEQARPAAAEALLSEAYTIARRTMGEGHRTTIFAAVHLGRARLASARHAEVESMLAPLVAVADSTLDAVDPLRGALRTQLAFAALRDGRRDEATRWLDEAEPLVPEHLTRATPWRADLRAARGELGR